MNLNSVYDKVVRGLLPMLKHESVTSEMHLYGLKMIDEKIRRGRTKKWEKTIRTFLTVVGQ